MFRLTSALVLAGTALLASACSGAAACPAGLVCGRASWLPPQNSASPDGVVVVAQASEVGGAGSSGRAVDSETLPVGVRPVLVRFDLSPLVGRGVVDRAILSLAPHASWRPTGQATHLVVHTIVGAWSAVSGAGASPAEFGPYPAADVTLPGRTRVPIRLDVTEAVRAWQYGTARFEGLAIASYGAPVVFAGMGAGSDVDRPRLEVMLR